MLSSLLVLPSYGNLPAGQSQLTPEQMNLLAQQGALLGAQQGLATNQSMPGPNLYTTDPATSYVVPENGVNGRAPNFQGLDYQAPNSNSVALYYQIQNQILQQEVNQYKWQQHQQMMKSAIDGMRGTFQTYVKSERQANDLFRTKFLDLQKGFFQSFHQQQAAIFAPIMEQKSKDAAMAAQYQALLDQMEKSDDLALGSETREDAEAKIKNGEMTQEELERRLKENTVKDNA